MGIKTNDSKNTAINHYKYGELIKTVAKGVSKPDWEPLKTHWTITGELCRKTERDSYASYPSQYNGGME